MSYTENFDAHARRLVGAEAGFVGQPPGQFYSYSNQSEAFWVPGKPVTGDTIVVDLPLTDERIETKVAELVDRKLREFVKASGIETNLRESQLPTARKDLIALHDHLNKLNEKLDFFLAMGNKIKEMQRQLDVLTRGPPK